MKCYIYTNELRAALLCASADKSHYILNAVHIESKPEKPALIVSTDGRRILIIQSQCAGVLDDSMDIILSAKFAQLILKVFTGNVPIEITTDDKAVTATSLGISIRNSTSGMVEGNYPKWRMVIPRKNQKRTPLSTLGFNTTFAAVLDKVNRALGNKTHHDCTFDLIDQHAVIVAKLVALDYVWFGIMPQRLEKYDSDLWLPEFLDLEPEAIAPATP